MYDMVSLLLGAAISGIGLSLTMFALASADRNSRFKYYWALGAALLVCHVFAYWFYARGAPIGVGVLACALQPVGAAFIYASVRQFMANEERPMRLVLRISIPYLLIVPPIFAAGYDGVALVLQNALTASMLLGGGIVYLRHSHEARLALGTLSGLYFLAGASFALCGLVILAAGQWQIGYPPQNWAEELNVVISVLCISGAGALTLSIDQTRMAKASMQTAMKDPLTGLLNRRGLAELRTDLLRSDDAVVVFDLDHFKQINDRYGHAVGDRVICAFADTLREQGRTTDAKARLGGEEYAMVMTRVSHQRARLIAQRVAEAFAATEIVPDDGASFRCTVSGGIAFGTAEGVDIEDVIDRADKALYAAKRGGRERVESEAPNAAPGLRLAS